MSIVTGKWITPPEVAGIASHYREAAHRIRLVAQGVSKVEDMLDGSWSGNAKNIFDAHYNSFPQELASYSDQLEHIAQEIANIQVWVETINK